MPDKKYNPNNDYIVVQTTSLFFPSGFLRWLIQLYKENPTLAIEMGVGFFGDRITEKTAENVLTEKIKPVHTLPSGEVYFDPEDLPLIPVK